jgi:fatty-acyl-CoA synthase
MLGRIKEVINVGGMKIFPADIESTFNDHPHVLESCAYAHTHPVLGEVPYLSVVLKSGMEEDCDEQSLRQYGAKHLPGYAVPSQIVIVNSLPRTASGKLIRRESAHPPPTPKAVRRFSRV